MSVRILIIEDEIGVVIALKKILRPIASLIDTVDNLADAIDLARRVLYNVIVQDIKLVAKDGRPATGKKEALEAIRVFKECSAAVVVVSGLAEENLEAEVLAAGADAFVAKDGNFTTRAMLLATHIATMHIPETSAKSQSYLSSVELLKNLVQETSK